MGIFKFMISVGPSSPKTTTKRIGKMYSILYKGDSRATNIEIIQMRKSHSVAGSKLLHFAIEEIEELVDLDDFVEVIIFIILCENTSLYNLLYDKLESDMPQYIKWANETLDVIYSSLSKVIGFNRYNKEKHSSVFIKVLVTLHSKNMLRNWIH